VAKERAVMSEALINSTGSIGTVSNITKYAEEIESLLTGNALPKLIATDELVEDPAWGQRFESSRERQQIPWKIILFIILSEGFRLR